MDKEILKKEEGIASLKLCGENEEDLSARLLLSLEESERIINGEVFSKKYDSFKDLLDDID